MAFDKPSGMTRNSSQVVGTAKNSGMEVGIEAKRNMAKGMMPDLGNTGGVPNVKTVTRRMKNRSAETGVTYDQFSNSRRIKPVNGDVILKG